MVPTFRSSGARHSLRSILLRLEAQLTLCSLQAKAIQCCRYGLRREVLLLLSPCMQCRRSYALSLRCDNWTRNDSFLSLAFSLADTRAMSRLSMLSPILIALCSLTLVTADCASRSAPADVAPVDVRFQQARFVKDYMAARHSKDAARIYNLIHPGVRACMTGQNKAYFDFVINHMLRDAPSGNYTKLTIKPVTPKTPPV